MKAILMLALFFALAFAVAWAVIPAGDAESEIRAGGRPIRVSEFMERHRQMRTPGAKPPGPFRHPVTGEWIERVLRPGDIE